MSGKPSQGRRCNGLTGLIVGHKFNSSTWDSESYVLTDHCQRCGMPHGGWPNPARGEQQ